MFACCYSIKIKTMENKIKSKIFGTMKILALAGTLLTMPRACSYLVQKEREWEKNPSNPVAYNYAGFAGKDYLIFDTGLSHISSLRVSKSNGQDIFYETSGNPSGDFNLESVYFYSNNVLQRKVESDSEAGKLEIATERQLEFMEYLSKIYKLKYGK